MSFKSAVTKLFSTLSNRTIVTTSPFAKITSDMVAYVNALSQFGDMNEDEIYEQMLVWEADIGGGIDRMSTLVRQSYAGVVIDSGEQLDESEMKCVRLGKEVAEAIMIGDLFESFSEILLTFGNLFLKKGDGSVEIQPNRFVTMVDSKNNLGQRNLNEVITSPNLFVLYENEQLLDTKTYPMDSIIHIKYKNTPIFQYDLLNRQTYGVYSLSPLQRAILPVWWKRQTMIIDIMWRWRNVPREHHKLDSSMFTLDKFSGSKSEKITAAQNSATTTIASYIETMKNQDPDTGYVTLDNVDINTIRQSSSYMQTNELMKQLDEKTWIALNIPESIVNGKNTGSYASELVVSNYVTAKVIQIAEKFKPTLLGLIRERVLAIDDSLPVHKLDIKLELMMAASKMELYRQAAIMASIGVFTDTEIRELTQHGPLTDDMRNEIVKSIREEVDSSVSTDVNKVTDGPSYPQTPQSDEQHRNDSGQKASRID